MKINRRWRRTIGTVASGAAILGLAAGVPPAAAQSADDCVVPDGSELARTSARTAEGNLEHEQWIANDTAQQAMSLMQATLDARFGESGKTAPDLPLARGLIGVVPDHHAQQVVVVVDPALVDSARLQADLLGVAAASPGSAQLGVRVQAGCHSAADLLAASKTIHSRDWHPRVREARYTNYLNPHTSTYQLTFGTGYRDVAEALAARLGDRVSIAYGEVARLDRADDGQPHWGGAGIGVVGGNNICTSGFTVDTRTAGKAMVTAGHCFSNGQRIESGNEAYGTAQGESGYPTWDMMLINASTQNYDDDIYHDPIRAEHSPLDVSGGSNPTMGASMCISGMVTRAVCGNVVNHLNATLCDEAGCTPGLVRTSRNGAEPCVRGDSGAPMYRGTSPAIVHAMLIGTDGVGCVGEKLSSIQSHLAVTVATSP